MKKWMKTLLLGAAFTILLCTSALAADKGIVKESLIPADGTLTAQKADGNAATEGKAGEKTVYADAERIAMSVNTESGMEYLVFVLKGENNTAPTADNIVYIDQKSGTGSKVDFDLYPSSLSNEKYTICMATSSATDGQLSVVGSFEYYAAFKLGDADGNERIQAKDAQCVMKHVAGITLITSETLKQAADADSNGRIQAKDAQRIMKHVAGIESLS